jgi:hypothetical protein
LSPIDSEIFNKIFLSIIFSFVRFRLFILICLFFIYLRCKNNRGKETLWHYIEGLEPADFEADGPRNLKNKLDNMIALVQTQAMQNTMTRDMKRLTVFFIQIFFVPQLLRFFFLWKFGVFENIDILF